MLTGGYPAIYDRKLEPAEWLANYVRTCVERDVRQVLNVGDLLSFQKFLGLCAGHSGQLLNLSALGASAGITHNTAKAWLSVLEASCLLRRLPSWFANLNKRLVKTPKLHFFDSGLLYYLLGIRSVAELIQHPHRGAIFQSWVVSEIHKSHTHRGAEPHLSFFRDHKGMEVDLLVEAGQRLLAVEIKSGQTIAADFFDALQAFTSLLGPRSVESVLVYGGKDSQSRSQAKVVAWSDVAAFQWIDARKKSKPARQQAAKRGKKAKGISNRKR